MPDIREGKGDLLGVSVIDSIVGMEIKLNGVEP